MLVYISSPYTVGNKRDNVNRQLRVANRLWDQGYTPIPPLLSHFWDIIYPKPWEKWIAYDLKILASCDCVLRLEGKSEGADLEVEEAKRLGIPVLFSEREKNIDIIPWSDIKAIHAQGAWARRPLMNEPITISLNEIAKFEPCQDGWRKALAALGKTQADNEQIPVSRFLNTNGLDDTLWALRCLPQYDALWRLYAVWCAKQVEQLMTDERGREALRVAERYALGAATGEELAVAHDAAQAATGAAWDAQAAAWDAQAAAQAAAGAAGDAWASGWAAAQGAAQAAVQVTARAAARAAAQATAQAASRTAGAATLAATRADQSATLRHLLDTRTIEIEWDGVTYLYEWEADDE